MQQWLKIMWLKIIKGRPDPVSVENFLLYIGKATKKNLTWCKYQASPVKYK